MSTYSRIKSTFQSLFQKKKLDDDLDKELRSYLDLLAQEKIDRGLNPSAARRQATLEFGGVEQVSESVRENRLGAAMDTFSQDIRYTFRILRKNAAFASIAALILAIGIGANTALFSTINTALLRQIPFAQPDRLVAGLKTRDGSVSGPVSRVDYYDYRDLSQSFVALAAIADFASEHTLTGDASPQLIHMAHVTWNLFPILGVNPVAGRHFLLEEETRRRTDTVIISYGLWQKRLGGLPNVVGKTLSVDGVQRTIVGVMPAGFRILFDADLWSLIDRHGPFDIQRDSHSHLVIGRLKPETTIQEAQSELDAISHRLAEQYPDTNTGKGLRVTDLHGFLVSNVRLSLLLLMGTTIMVLLIACGNVAGLLLARGQRRRSEMAMRSALGAPRGRLVRQLLTESVILTLIAGLLGIAFAYLLQNMLLRLLPMGEIGIDRPIIDAGALLFALAISVTTGLIVGVVPAIRCSSLRLSQKLKPGTHMSAGVRTTRLRSGLVVFQVALSIIMLIGSGLLIRSLRQLTEVELGFDPEKLLIGRIRIQSEEYPTAGERRRFFASVVEEIESLPGVESAILINKLPIRSRWQDWGIWPADEPRPSIQDTYFAMARWVTPGYFKTMRMPLLRGRDVAATDSSESPRVVVVSESVAKALFADPEALGQAVKIGWSDETFSVIGVVGDSLINTLRRGPEPAMYMASAQIGATRLELAVRTSIEPRMLVAPVDDILAQMDPGVILADPTTMTAVIDDNLGDFRIVIMSLSLFAAVALILTAIGLYGMLAYDASQRTNEIGIRLALGASVASILQMVLKRGLTMIAVGLLLGAFAAYPGTQMISNLLYETRLLDTTTYISAIGFLAMVGFWACFLPAWRATRLRVTDVLHRE